MMQPGSNAIDMLRTKTSIAAVKEEWLLLFNEKSVVCSWITFME